MIKFRVVPTGGSCISTTPMATHKVYGCVATIVRRENEMYLAHYINGWKDKLEDVKLFFKQDLTFLERNLFDQKIRTAFIFGGNPKTVDMIKEYFNYLGINILMTRSTEYKYPQQDFYLFPASGRVIKVGLEKRLEYLLTEK